MDQLSKQKIKRLASSSDWEIIYPFMAYIIEQWNKDEVKRDDQFNTMWNVANREGKIAGVKELIEAVEKIAFDTN